MSTAVALVCRVVRRRVERGEELTAVLADYPRLTEKQRAEIVETLSKGYSQKTDAAHLRNRGVPLFWAKIIKQGSFMEFALHFLGK